MSQNIDANSGIPKYIQLREILLARLVAGEFRAGDKFLTEEALKRAYRLSSATVARTMRDMAEAGYLVRRKGSGTYVCPFPPHGKAQGAPTAPRTIYVFGARPDESPAGNPLNWFVGFEIYRGIAEGHDGPVRALSATEAVATARGLSPERTDIVLVNPTVETLAAVRDRGFSPAVICQSGQGVYAADTVRVDVFSGCYAGMTYLIETLGHRDIALITRGEEAHRARVAGYRAAIGAYELTLRDAWIVKTSQGTEESGAEAMMALSRSDRRPTAVFVDTDIKAIGAIRAASVMGLRVPEDISVLGFDDIPGSDRTVPPLTTVRYPFYELGTTALKLLKERRVSPDAPWADIVLKTSLVVRRSCAPPPSLHQV